MLFVIFLVCGLLIGAAVFLFGRSIRLMSKGRCCGGCGGCAMAGICSSGPDAGSGGDKS